MPRKVFIFERQQLFGVTVSDALAPLVCTGVSVILGNAWHELFELQATWRDSMVGYNRVVARPGTPLVRPCSIILACLQHQMLHDDVVATRINFGEGRLGFARRGDRSQLARMQGISKQSTGATCRHKKYIGASHEDGVRSRLFPTTK